jgi:Fe-S cluster assembly protein SufB
MAENKNNDILDEVTQSEYKYGFYTDIEMDQAPKGLNEDTIRFISAKKTNRNSCLSFA